MKTLQRISVFLLCFSMIFTMLPTGAFAEIVNDSSEGVQGNPISNADYIMLISDVSSDNYVMSDNGSYSLPVSLPVSYGTSSKTYYHPDSNVTAIKIRLEVDINADLNDTDTTTDDCYDILYVYDGKGNNIACYDGREMSIFDRTQELIIQGRYFTLTLVRKSAKRKLKVIDLTGSYSYYLPDTYVTRYAPDPYISVTEVKGYSANNSLKMVTCEDGVDILSFDANEGATSVVIERSTNNIDWTAVTTLDRLTQLSTQAKVYNNGNCYYRLNVTGGYRAGISNVVRNYVDASEFAFSNGTITNYTGSGNFVVIPSEINGEKVTAIGEFAFAKTYIETVIIPDSVEKIGNYAFTKSSGIFDSQLKRVVVEGNNLTEIGEGAFKYCSSLESVVLPNSVENIGDYAFYHCSKLTFTKLPSNWKTIGNYAFYGVGEITNLVIPDDVTDLSTASLSATKICSLHIGEGLTSIAGLNLANKYLQTITVSQNNQSYSSQDGVLYNKDKTELVRFPVGLCLVSEHVDYGYYKTIIPEGVQIIAHGAFSGCTGILELVLPESLIEIKANAFSNCDLLRIRMQNGLQTIGSSAFSNSGLSGYVHIPDSVTSIGSRAFENCMVKYVSLPAGLRTIQSYTFYDCDYLTTIYIPKSVGSIQTYAFSGCDDIYHVFYGGTYDEWQALSIANYNVPLTSAKSSSYKYNGVSIAYEKEGFFICKNDTLYYYIGYSSEVTIPSTVDGVTLTKIGDNAFDYKNYLFGNTIYDVVIPDSITSIGSYAFRGQSIDAVKLPPNLTSIGAYAFAECDFTYIIIPDTVTSLGAYAFADCYQLYAIAVGNGLNNVSVENLNTAFSNRGIETDHDPIFCFSGTYDELWSGNVGDCDICYGAVFDNATLYITDEGLLVIENVDGKITIWNYQGADEHLDLYDIDKDSTQQTSLSTYFSSNRLTTIILPSKTDYIFSNQFSSTRNLTTIAIPNTVDAIYTGAFANCSKLSLVYFLGTEEEWNAITIKGNNDPLLNATIQFQYSTETAPKCLSYEIENGEVTITDCDTSATGELVIPTTIKACPVTGLGEYAFYGCCGLTSITIPSSVTSIGQCALSNCYSLAGIWVDEENAAYSSDKYGVLFNKEKTELIQAPGAMQGSYIISDSVQSIGKNAFRDCTSLSSVTIPDSVTFIGSYAFSGCSGLTSVTIPDSVTSIDYAAFASCDSLSSVTIPNRVTSIGEYAFYGCSSLISVTVPDSVTSIGESAFSGCSSLESITIPFVGGSKKTASDTYQYPFGYIFGTSSYTGGVATTQYYYGSSTSSDTGSTYYIPSSLKCVTVTEGNILYGAFSYCTGLTSVTIGDSVTSIGEGAFYKCTSLTSVTIPDSVTSIGNYAFYNCTSLKHVAYSGTQAQWNKISIGSYNSPLIGAAIWHYEAVDQVYFKKNCVEAGAFCDLCREFITKETVESGKHTYEDAADTYCDDCGYTRTLAEIAIEQHPAKQNYSLLRDELDTTGGTILVTYSDSSTEEIAITEDMVAGFDNRIYGQQILTVTYEGHTATYTIQCVADYTPDKLEILSKPEQVSYLTNQELIWDGLSIKATYEDVEVELALAELTIDAVDMTTPGIKTVTLRYYDAAVTFPIFVHEMVRTTADSSSYPESNHNYAANTNETKIFTYPGAEQLRLTFSSQSYTESNYDFVYILDGEGNQIGKYSGNLAGKVVAVPGDTVQIKLTSDHIVNKYGYAFASIEAEMILHPGEGFCEICGEFKATSGETASLTESMTLEAFTIPAGVTVDLSGHVLTVDSLASFGQIIDSVGGGGLIAGNVEITSNDWLPILDSTGCYRFYEYAVENLGTKSGDDSAIFGFALDFEDAMAYTTLLGSDDVQVVVTLAVGDTTKTYAFSQELIEKYVNLVAKYPALRPYLRLNVAGLDTVADGTVLTVTPALTAVDGKISKTGVPMIYTA